MRVIYGIGKAQKVFKKAVVAIGVFDGLHIGHQKLIKKAVERAKKNKGEAVVMTFAPHPMKILNPAKYLPYITPLSCRLKLIENLGVSTCVVVNFTKRFANLNPQDFVKRYLVQYISPEEIFVGNEFRFGKERGGTIEFLKDMGKKYGFKVNAIVPLKSKKTKIGSSGIRQFIADGKLAMAKRHLGRYVSLAGKVVRGDGRGRKLGFPTANLIIKEEIIPPQGVYAVYVWIKNQRFKGMANIGIRPSFKKSALANIEIHIFDFKKSIYDQEILVEFVKKIRNEREFPSKEKLISQLEKDEIKSRQILN